MDSVYDDGRPIRDETDSSPPTETGEMPRRRTMPLTPQIRVTTDFAALREGSNLYYSTGSSPPTETGEMPRTRTTPLTPQIRVTTDFAALREGSDLHWSVGAPEKAWFDLPSPQSPPPGFSSMFRDDDLKPDIPTVASDNGKREHGRGGSDSQQQYGANLHGQYHCNQCVSKSFATASALKAHQKHHTPNAERPYGCQLCPQRFLYPKDLRRHQRTHKRDEDYPYQCSKCGARFIRPDELEGHQLRVCRKLVMKMPRNTGSSRLESNAIEGSADSVQVYETDHLTGDDMHLEPHETMAQPPYSLETSPLRTSTSEPDLSFLRGDEHFPVQTRDNPSSRGSSPEVSSIDHSNTNTRFSGSSLPSRDSMCSHAYLAAPSSTAPTSVDPMTPYDTAENGERDSENETDEAESIRTDGKESDLALDVRRGLSIRLAEELLQGVDFAQHNTSVELKEHLLDLLKHFSDTVGSLSKSKVEDLTSGFVRHRRDYIAKHMVLQSVSKELPVAHNLPTAQNKVMNWNVDIRATGDDLPSRPVDIDLSNLSEEITEADVDENAILANLHPNLPAAWKFLRDSPDYTWLRRRVLQQQTFTVKGCEAYRGVRRAVTEFLAPPKSPPLGAHYSLDLLVDWDPVDYVRTQFQQERVSASIGSDIILCGQYPDVEAWNCEDYVARVWPEIGPQLLQSLNATLGDKLKRTGRESFEDHVTQLQLGQSTRCRLSYLAGGTRCEVQGYLLHVVQVAEVLAWLGAGCRASPHSEQPAYCTPKVHINGNSITIGYSHEVMTETFTQDADAGCWRQMTRNPMIVTGYPQSIRHNNEMGLEASLQAMVALGRTNLASHFDRHLLLKGDRSMLVPVEKRGDSIIWHFIRGTADTFLSYMESMACKTIAAISYEDVSNCRHFIGWTQEAISIAGTKLATYDIGPSGCEPPGPTHLLTGLTLSFSKILAVGASMTLAHRHTPLVFEKSQPYGVKIRIAARWTVLMYDAASRLGWLMDGATALMHLARTWLFRNQFLFGDVDIGDKIQEIDPQTSDWARKTLSHYSNGRMRLHPKSPTYDWQDEYIRPWFGTVASSECTDWALFQERVDCLHDALAKIDGEVRKRKAIAGIQLKRSDRSLEGFDVADVLDEIEGTESKAQVLRKDAMPWLKMVNENNTICLLGSSFGQLIRPVNTLCPARAMVPSGSDCLATCVSTLQLFQTVKRSNSKCDRVEFGSDVFLQYPLSAFEKSSNCAQCRLGSWCPNTISSLSTNNLLMKRPREAAARHATSLWHYDRGAIIFGGELCRVAARAGRWSAAKAQSSNELGAVARHNESASSSISSNVDQMKLGFVLDSSESRDRDDSSTSSRLRARDDTPPSSVSLPQASISDLSRSRLEQVDVCTEDVDMSEPFGTPSAMVDSLDGSHRSSNERIHDPYDDPGTSAYDTFQSNDNAQRSTYNFDVQGLQGSLPHYVPLRDLYAGAQSSGEAPGGSCNNATAHSLSASNKPKLRKRPKMR